MRLQSEDCRRFFFSLQQLYSVGVLSQMQQLLLNLIQNRRHVTLVTWTHGRKQLSLRHLFYSITKMRRYSFFLTSAICLLSSMAWARPDSPAFSQAHGYMSQPFKLTITPTVEGREIYYTTDCSTPTLQSRLYTGEITIRKSTVVRAAERVEGDSLSFVTTATYIFPENVLSQCLDGNDQPMTPSGYPSTWGPYVSIYGTAPGYYAVDKTIATESRANVLEGLSQLPVVSMVSDIGSFFSKTIDPETGGIYIYTGAPTGDGTGRDWERHISLELFGGPLEWDYTHDCGTKIHGGHSRLPEKNPKHAFRLMFKSKYGAKKLKYPIYGEGAGMVDKFEDLVLRTYFGYAWTHWDETNRTRAQYTRDLFARSIQERLGWPASHGQPVHLFLNGMYWGMYNLCERINDDYCEQHFGGDKSDYDVIKVDENEGEAVVAADGTLTKWEGLQMLINMLSTMDKKGYYRLEGRNENGEPDDNIQAYLDMDNFIDYMLINIYGGNGDWDHHNWLAYRRIDDSNQGFRFFCWDSELILLDVNDDVTGKCNEGKPSGMLNKLMNNYYFKKRFNHRAHLMFGEGGVLSCDGAVAVFDSLYHNIDKAIYSESARWGVYRRDIHPYQSKGHRYRVDSYYMNERNRLLSSYFPLRTSKVISQLKKKGWYSEQDSYVDDIPAIEQEPEIWRQQPFYDLEGREVTDPQSGHIYIQGGKKIVF